MSASDNISSTILAIRTHKMKIIFAVISFVFFLAILFPFDDLGDVVTEKIAQATQNQVFLQFDHLGVAFLPPSLEMQNVTLDTPFFSSVKASSMTLAPAIGRLLTFQPGVSFSAEGLFKGDYSGSIGMTKQNNRQHVEFTTKYKNIDLLTVSQFFESPWEVSGKANLFIDDGLVDPAMTNPPKAEVELRGEKVALPNTLPASIPMLGGTVIPTLKFAEVLLRGRLINRELIIDQGTLGSETDPFHGKIKGRLELDFRQGPGGVVPQLGGYDLTIGFEMDRAFEAELQKKLSIVSDILAKYKSVTGKGSRYALRLRTQNPMMPPEILSVSEKDAL